MPTYYVMDKDKGMAATVAPFMPSAAEIAACKWLTDAELARLRHRVRRTGFTGALQGYRVRRGSDPKSLAEMRTFSGRTIDVPSASSPARATGAPIKRPGAVESMRTTRLHPDGRLPSRRRRRPLGAAGAVGETLRSRLSPIIE